MKLWLVQHSLKSVRRSPDFQRKVVVSVIFGFFMVVVALELLILGLFLHDILTKYAPPGTDSLDRVNGVLLIYFGIDFVLRLVFQKFRSAQARHYLLQRVTRNQITHYVLLKTLGTMVNFLPFLILIPFFFAGVVRTHAFLSSIAWLISFLSLMFFNTYFVAYAKLKFFKNAVRTSAAVGVLIAVLVAAKFELITLTPVSTLLFGSILIHPGLAFVLLLCAAGMYGLNFRFLRHHLYLEDLAVAKGATTVREHFPLLGGFGEIGTLISLDVKLMMRNKRARISLWMPFLMVFYGLFFYPTGQYHGTSAETDFILLFIGSFITGFFIITYGISTFCYESRYFGLILTNKVDMFTYLKARYFFMLLMTLPVYLISLFYAWFGTRILVVNSLMFLFNIGFTAFFFLYLATYNKLKFDLGVGYFSTQGKGSNQFVAVFALMAIVAIPFFSVRSLAGSSAAFVALGIIGVTGFILHNKILALLVRQFERRKYVMSEGFRAQ
jgi:hypothetical protein